MFLRHANVVSNTPLLQCQVVLKLNIIPFHKKASADILPCLCVKPSCSLCTLPTLVSPINRSQTHGPGKTVNSCRLSRDDKCPNSLFATAH